MTIGQINFSANVFMTSTTLILWQLQFPFVSLKAASVSLNRCKVPVVVPGQTERTVKETVWPRGATAPMWSAPSLSVLGCEQTGSGGSQSSAEITEGPLRWNIAT